MSPFLSPLGNHSTSVTVNPEIAMDRAAQCRQKAQECRDLAQTFSDGVLRNHYLEVPKA
jgi:hypothetical protein